VGKPRPYGEYIAGMLPGRRPVKTKTNKNSFFSFSNHFFLKKYMNIQLDFMTKKFQLEKKYLLFFLFKNKFWCQQTLNEFNIFV
jgi:hypothetical protein